MRARITYIKREVKDYFLANIYKDSGQIRIVTNENGNNNDSHSYSLRIDNYL